MLGAKVTVTNIIQDCSSSIANLDTSEITLNDLGKIDLYDADFRMEVSDIRSWFVAIIPSVITNLST